jgi:hypothetical protein
MAEQSIPEPSGPAQRWEPAPGTAGISQRVAAPREEGDEDEAILLDVLVEQANLVCYVNEY